MHIICLAVLDAILIFSMLLVFFLVQQACYVSMLAHMCVYYVFTYSHKDINMHTHMHIYRDHFIADPRKKRVHTHTHTETGQPISDLSGLETLPCIGIYLCCNQITHLQTQTNMQVHN
jgi:hypothetical protein